MSHEWAVYSLFGLMIVLISGSFFHFWNVPKSKKLSKLLKFRQALFGLQKDFLLLNEKKELHDAKVTDFVSSLIVPKGRGVTARKVKYLLDEKEETFKQLLHKENFFSSCKKRTLEIVKELETLNSKSLRKSLKLIEKKEENGSWAKELNELRTQAQEFKDNKNLLIHSFSSFQNESRKKLLSFKKVS